MAKHFFAKISDTIRCVLPARFDVVRSHYNNAYAARMDRFAQSKKYEGELRKMVSGLLIDSRFTVLDLGCNTGQSMYRAHQWTGCTVVGIDQNRCAIEQAKLQFPDYRFDYYASDTLPFENGSFDAVMLNHVIAHVAKPTELMKEVFRVLKPSGRVGIITPNRYYKLSMLLVNLFNNYNPDRTILRYYTTSSLSKLFGDSGFQIEHLSYTGEFPGWLAFLQSSIVRFRVFGIGSKMGR